MRDLVRTVGVLVGAGSALTGAAVGVITRQGRKAHQMLTIRGWYPFRADGVYYPDGSGPEPPSSCPPDTLRLAMLGDSTAAGLGVDSPDELPGVVLAKGLAEETGRPVLLDTYAVSGYTTRKLAGQVDAALTRGPDAALTRGPDAALIMIGANDVRLRVPPRESALLLEAAVIRLRSAGAAVVVGTCPDLGAVRSIPQPLRAIAQAWSRWLARLQRTAVLRAGGVPVPLADLLSSEFLTQPEALFSRDRYHPSAAGYDAACSVLLPALCSALGVWAGTRSWSASLPRSRRASPDVASARTRTRRPEAAAAGRYRPDPA